ncbi:TPA: hypothetical protein ACJXCU_003173, partial [Yersinia enterocolitica]
RLYDLPVFTTTGTLSLTSLLLIVKIVGWQFFASPCYFSNTVRWVVTAQTIRASLFASAQATTLEWHRVTVL